MMTMMIRKIGTKTAAVEEDLPTPAASFLTSQNLPTNRGLPASSDMHRHSVSPGSDWDSTQNPPF